MSTTPDIIGLNFIDGKRVGENSTVLYSVDAVTKQRLAQAFVVASVSEVEAAVKAAQKAYPLFRNISSKKRAEFLDVIAQELEALGDEFIKVAVQETALPLARIQGELLRTSNQMRLFATVLRRGDFYGARIDTAQPQRAPLPKPDLRTYNIGLGPVAVFGASNFPLAFSVAGGDTASALAAGCPVVVKAHPGHLYTSEYVAGAICKAVERCQLPSGTFNMVFGEIETGEALVLNPAIKAVGFTGSLRAGRAICDLAARRPEPIPVFAEMSSINPVVVLPNALDVRGDVIALQLANSITVGCGQFCTQPGLILAIKSPELDLFIENLAKQISEKDAQTMLNSGVLQNYEMGVARLEIHPSVTLLAKGRESANSGSAMLFKADFKVLAEGDAIVQEEVFGPLSIIVEVEDKDQLTLAISKLRGQLTGTLLAEPEDLKTSAILITQLEEKVGRIILNGYPTGVEVCDAMVHGGPYPATSDSRGTSVGTLAIERYLRPVCYQDYPDEVLPEPLKNSNPLGLRRLVNGIQTEIAI
ncbi:aldehyde dehydrogenase (NADP(+)) [Vibrio ziniensis]|uniref:Aldehyde dehydrogenase (NADP(+)) n=1 Tax=Vibrio ziniensis TaxID=2711221 RepID=A0A6G7CIY8_9VIBR|nr:aldehyde dehydrogenase (NADP(+)) [Vibrio ziniensis]QIH42077.1 aldehyde dehydrogenase (NADP(+)) [Vibrio ziniensis]